ncbi:MAG: hypothetical protein D6805_04635 [Planctomycetota bacterium]|nr:MAG: hypothetical protein D6805_04635 [Planctomycetota bacterium]
MQGKHYQNSYIMKISKTCQENLNFSLKPFLEKRFQTSQKLFLSEPFLEKGSVPFLKKSFPLPPPPKNF